MNPEAPRRPPFDRRLLREARSARPAVIGAVVVGTAMTTAVLVQLVALATIIGRAFTSPASVSPRTIAAPLAVLVAAVCARALLALAGEVVAERGATAVRRELRSRLLRCIVERGPVAGPTGAGVGEGGSGGPDALGGPGGLDGRGGAGGLGTPAGAGGLGENASPGGELLVLATRGIDALDLYFSGYLPQLVVGVLAPVILLGWLLFSDRWSVLVLAGTLAVVPVFMVLLGQEAAHRMRRQWDALQHLGGHFADVVGGITTLKLYDRVEHQLHAIAVTTDRLRRATLDTLRYAFLSSFVFELLASLATALVAIVLGLRLLSGAVHLGTALAVLFIAPEVFLPLRKASARFHSAADGIGASDRLLAILGAGSPGRVVGGANLGADSADGARTAISRGSRTPCPPTSPSGPLVDLHAAVLSRPGSRFTLGPLDLSVSPGEHVALVGPTGCGKSTLLLALLGYLVPVSGDLLLGGCSASGWAAEQGDAGEAASWRQRVSWLPQAPAIVSGSLLANVCLTAPPGSGDPASALRFAGASDLVSSLGGLGAHLRERGSGLSSGERQRIALARALYRKADLYLLDEPTAHLDRRLETAVVSGIFEAVASAAVVLVTHSSAVAARCDRVIDLDAGWFSPPAHVPGRSARPALHAHAVQIAQVAKVAGNG